MRKQLMIGLIAAAGMNLASACQISLWNGVNTATAANTGEATAGSGFSRYSGKCSLRTTGGAAATYVEDISVNGATTYKARFYLFTGDANTTGTGFVYVARSSGGSPADMIRIALNGSNLETTVAGAATQPTAVPVVANRYYAVELEWANGTAQPFALRVTGSATGTSVTETRTATVTQAATLGSVRLGLSAGATGTAQFDEYDSRRTTNPGRLCRGDANNNAAIQGNDRGAITNDINGTLALGQPDCNENGLVQGSDRGCVTALIAAAATCN